MTTNIILSVSLSNWAGWKSYVSHRHSEPKVKNPGKRDTNGFFGRFTPSEWQQTSFCASACPTKLDENSMCLTVILNRRWRIQENVTLMDSSVVSLPLNDNKHHSVRQRRIQGNLKENWILRRHYIPPLNDIKKIPAKDGWDFII